MKGYPTRAVAKFGGVLGTAVVALGFGAIGFGWYGAAGPGGRINGVPDLRAQLPYVLSGGLLGLGLISVGGVLIVTEALRADRDLLLNQLRELAARETTQRDRDNPHQHALVVYAGQYHRLECPTLSGLQRLPQTSPAAASTSGLMPCRICRPDAHPDGLSNGEVERRPMGGAASPSCD